jgi:galactitol-specific phosphotransferase system IIB component
MNVDVSTGEIITVSNEVVPPQDEKIEYDYEQTRNNLYNLLNQGQDALIAALSVAKQSEHPRAFEVVGNLMTQLADVNEKLMKLHEKKQKLDLPSKKEEQAKQVTNNNAIFVGSTTELNKMLQNMTKGN